MQVLTALYVFHSLTSFHIKAFTMNKRKSPSAKITGCFKLFVIFSKVSILYSVDTCLLVASQLIFERRSLYEYCGQSIHQMCRSLVSLFWGLGRFLLILVYLWTVVIMKLNTLLYSSIGRTVWLPIQWPLQVRGSILLSNQEIQAYQ